VIDYAPDMLRAAVLEDGKLCEVHHERRENTKLTESLFYGRIQSIRPSVGAAFVDIGEAQNAFLPLDADVNLKCGDCLIVQGTAVQAVETKGLRVSSTINLAGKWLVLVPGAQGVRLSKKIKDSQLREALMQAVEPVCPQGCGLIVRTASSDVTLEALHAEAGQLYTLWRQIEARSAGMTKPGLLHAPLGLAMQLARDLGSTLSRVVTNGHVQHALMLEAQENGWIPEAADIQMYDETQTRTLLGDTYELDAQIDKALRRRVWLDCGGYIVFDSCEALTVVDVNSGKMVLGRDTEDTALRVNLEAAREIGRQLRLRDIGGIIVVDYIDMKEETHRQQLLDEIKRVSLFDRSQVTVSEVSRLGLVEMTRKRKGELLQAAMQTACKRCGGEGRFLSAQETAHRALRQLRRMLLAGQRGPFLICAGPQAVQALCEMHIPDTTTPVYALGEQGKHADRFEIRQLDIAAKVPHGAVQLNKG